MNNFKQLLSKQPLKLLTLLLSTAILATACQDETFNEFNAFHESTEISTTGVVIKQQAGEIIEGEYIVMLNPETREVQRAMSSRSEIEREKDITTFSQALVKDARIRDADVEGVLASTKQAGFFLKNVSLEETNRLARDSRVTLIEPNTIISMSLGDEVSAHNYLDAEFKSILVPADDKTMKKESKDFLKEIGGSKDMKNSSKKAWIIDSGIDLDHDDLNVNVSLSRTFARRTFTAEDELGHGTHVAGIIGAKDDKKGITGVASGIELVSVRVLDGYGFGTKFDLIQALIYVANNITPGDLVNISLSTEDSHEVDVYTELIVDAGGIVTVSAGNYYEDIMNYSPCNLNVSGIFIVGATDQTGEFASFSNFGSNQNYLLAPGTGIYSTYLNNQYAIMSGTSMAAPILGGMLLIKKDNEVLDLSEFVNTPTGEKPKAKISKEKKKK